MNKYVISSETTKSLYCLFEILWQSLSTTSNIDCELLGQKSRQKFSLMKAKKPVVSKKIVCFGILIHVLSWRQQKCQYLCFNCWDFFTSFWRNNWQSLFDVVERLCYSYESKYVSTFVKKKVLGFSLGKIHTKVSKYLCTFVKKALGFMLLACYKKSYLICVEFSNFRKIM